MKEEKDFLSLPPCLRAKKLKSLLYVFNQNAKVLHSPFSIIAYGSAAYGFNKNNHGKLDDLDFFLIIPRNIDSHLFISLAQMIFLTKVNIQMDHLFSVLAGESDICRMYGHANGIKIGFRIICLDVFELICSKNGSTSLVRNIASIGQSRILNDREWHFKLKKYVPILYKNKYCRIGSEEVLLTIQYCFPKRQNRLGPLARKLLMGTVVWDAFSTSANIKKLWEIFITNSMKFSDQIDADSIIKSIIRSERFSNCFRDKLHKIIKDVLNATL